MKVMPSQIKLSKLFYVNPTLLPTPSPISPRHFPIFLNLKKDILTNGFDSKRPIIVPVPRDKFGGPVRWKHEQLNEFPRFPSATSIKELLYISPSTGWSLPWQRNKIADGNHRLAVALELKLDYVPVRFEYMMW